MHASVVVNLENTSGNQREIKCQHSILSASIRDSRLLWRGLKGRNIHFFVLFPVIQRYLSTCEERREYWFLGEKRCSLGSITQGTLHTIFSPNLCVCSKFRLRICLDKMLSVGGEPQEFFHEMFSGRFTPLESLNHGRLQALRFICHKHMSRLFLISTGNAFFCCQDCFSVEDHKCWFFPENENEN